MVMIRLARVGARKQPYYRVVVIEKDRANSGRNIEVVGTYNPRTSPATVDLKLERIAYWRSKGARLSPTLESWSTRKQPSRPRPQLQNPRPRSPIRRQPDASRLFPACCVGVHSKVFCPQRVRVLIFAHGSESKTRVGVF